MLRGGIHIKRNYILRRLSIIVPTFFGITVLAYIISSMAPGSPLDALLADPHITEAEIGRRRIALGLDQSVMIQYFNWLKEFLRGNLGFSFKTQRPVSTMILERLGPTILLASSSVLLSLLVALPLGILAAIKPYSTRDYAFSGISFLMAATPNFFAGLVLIYIFAAVLRILPTGGMYDSSGVRSVGILLKHLILPTLVLSFQQIGSWIRYMRGSMLEVMKEEYIRTAKAKGLTRTLVIYRHALKNALIPVVTVVGMSVPSLVGGAVVTEQIFGWPGIGSLMVQSISARDYPVIMGITVVVSAVVLIANLVTDLVYGVLDPRISYN